MPPVGGEGGVGPTTGGQGPETGGTGGIFIDPNTITGPEGTIPNTEMPETMVDLARNDWREGLVSPRFEVGHPVNQPIVFNGYLVATGNSNFAVYDISDPTDPEFLSRTVSPSYRGYGEAESHQTSLGRYGNTFYQVMTAGQGVDIFDMSDLREPRHVGLVEIPGVNYGDFTEAVWGMAWQGNVIYVGGTNTGLHVLDATDPENVVLVESMPTSQIGGISAGPLWAVGNILVITTPKENGGIATMDISDPMNPIPLSAITPNKSYIGGFYGHHAYLLDPTRVWDVLTDPLDIGTANAPAGFLATEAAEYFAFSDGYLFLGHMRPNGGASKVPVTDLSQMHVERRIWGHLQFSASDFQFILPFGSLIVMGDEEHPNHGMVIGVHSTEPDTTPPAVDTVVPKDGATGQNRKVRIGLSMTDNIEFTTVHPGSFIVRPVGGEPLSGSYGLSMTVLSFAPDEELMPNTTYEVLLPAGGVKDLVGNGIASEFRSTFTTGP